jgi:hypothetical protein
MLKVARARPTTLIPGASWQPAIEDALQKCESCAVFIGSASRPLNVIINERFRQQVDQLNAFQPEASITEEAQRCFGDYIGTPQRRCCSTALPSW